LKATRGKEANVGSKFARTNLFRLSTDKPFSMSAAAVVPGVVDMLVLAAFATIFHSGRASADYCWGIKIDLTKIADEKHG
jgi:hypothetical protein